MNRPSYTRVRAYTNDRRIDRYFKVTNLSGEPPGTVHHDTVPQFDYASRIIDWVSGPDRHGVYPERPVHHTVSSASLGFVPDILWGSHEWDIHTYDMTDFRIPLSESAITDGVPIIPASSVEELCLEAFNYFSTVFPEELNVAEFTQGLFELKALLPEIQSSITKTISGGYLNKKFGWDNLLRDLDVLSSGFKGTIARMKYLRDTYGQRNRLSFNRSNFYTPSGTAFDPYMRNNDWADGSGKTWIQLSSYRADFRASCWITNTLKGLDQTVGLLRATMGALGLDSPVRAFWNLVPLSFVVDWFFGIDQHLDRLTRVRPAQGWDVSHITHSVKASCHFKISMQVTSNPPLLTEEVATGTALHTSYDRGVGLPVTLGTLDPEGLSPEQLVLLLAILHQGG